MFFGVWPDLQDILNTKDKRMQEIQSTSRRDNFECPNCLRVFNAVSDLQLTYEAYPIQGE